MCGEFGEVTVIIGLVINFWDFPIIHLGGPPPSKYDKTLYTGIYPELQNVTDMADISV